MSAGVMWSVSGTAETLAVSEMTVVAVNGETFCLTRIPFETRQLADHTPLPTATMLRRFQLDFAGKPKGVGFHVA